MPLPRADPDPVCQAVLTRLSRAPREGRRRLVCPGLSRSVPVCGADGWPGYSCATGRGQPIPLPGNPSSPGDPASEGSCAAPASSCFELIHQDQSHLLPEICSLDYTREKENGHEERRPLPTPGTLVPLEGGALRTRFSARPTRSSDVLGRWAHAVHLARPDSAGSSLPPQAVTGPSKPNPACRGPGPGPDLLPGHCPQPPPRRRHPKALLGHVPAVTGLSWAAPRPG